MYLAFACVSFQMLSLLWVLEMSGIKDSLKYQMSVAGKHKNRSHAKTINAVHKIVKKCTLFMPNPLAIYIGTCVLHKCS